MEYLHQDKTEKIIQAFFKVYNTLGYGFLDIVDQLVQNMKITTFE